MSDKLLTRRECGARTSDEDYYYICRLGKGHKGNHFCLEKSWRKKKRKKVRR